MFKKLGFIGAGKQAQAHAKAAVALGAEIKTVYFMKPRQLPECFDGADHLTYPDAWNEMENDALAAIIACAPWNVIPEMMPELLACDLPILIEKPILLKPYTEWPEHVTNKYVAMNRRFYGVVGALKKTLKKAEIVSVEAVWSDQVDELEERHLGITPYLMEMYSIHMLDLLYYLFGRIKVQFRCGSIDATLYPVQESWNTVFPIHLSITQNNPQKSGVTVRTKEQGCLVLSPLEELNVYRRMEVIEAGGARIYQPQYAMRQHESGGIKPGIVAQMEAFLNQEEGKLATIDDAIYVHNLINELRS